ncbi:FAD-dependent oxidoreductase [Roseomonas sp. 18066]|uniref:hydroxysqualene dehydroxylase n=1 Tax=Roseomonas sp. 18066 TaxID=2681412 RepID=UPI0013579088|nr:FAD-dependent oxidoreductase [Roseomonas sp. 18066]
MSQGLTLHVVGAGIAGLAAALEAAARGHAVTLHEATGFAGGRARALPDGGDNGTHVLLGANTAALDFLERIGARHRWIEPEPGSLPVYDLATGRLRQVALDPRRWRDPARRPPGMTWPGFLAVLRAGLPWQGGTVAEAFARHPVLLRGFVAPLVLAALNTDPAEAGVAWLGPVLRRLARPGAGRLLVARDGLGPDLVQPALAALGRQGVRLQLGHRLRGIERQGGRATALVFGDGAVPLDRRTAAILALPPWEAARLLPGLAVPAQHAPILNLHFAHATGGPPRFLGLLGGAAQWVLLRPGAVSVTISAAGGQASDALVPVVWSEIRRVALAAGLPGPWPETPPPCRLVREQRATPLHGVERAGPPRLRPLRHLALAGDWMAPGLPATLEAAVRTGRRAGQAFG